MTDTSIPIIGMPADSHEKDNMPAHSAGAKYIDAALNAAGCIPLIIPAFEQDREVEAGAILDRLDGLIIPGSSSNVHPHKFGQEPHCDFEPYDRPRDATSLKLITAALARGMPLLCICRGLQELNVAHGGSLDTEIHTMDGRLDHRAPQSDDHDVRYGPAHSIQIEPGSRLDQIIGQREITVNTVHRQAISRLGKGLKVEARAPDGTIEAISVISAPGFNIAVQWHPEYRAMDNPDSVKLFAAFGDAARKYMNT